MLNFEAYYYSITSITIMFHYFQWQLLPITSITLLPNLDMAVNQYTTADDTNTVSALIKFALTQLIYESIVDQQRHCSSDCTVC